MPQEMLNALFFPLLFSMGAGTYAYLRFPERRAQAVLIVILFQLVGAYGHFVQPDSTLFGLLVLHAAVAFFLVLHWVQHPAAPARETVSEKPHR